MNLSLLYLATMFVLSAINVGIFTVRYRKQQNGYVFYLFCAIMVTDYGHMLLGMSTSLESAVIANKINYLGSAFLPLFMLWAVLQVCKIQLSQLLRFILFSISCVVCFLAMTVGYSEAYYKTIDFVVQSGVGNYVATYGWGHDVFNAMLVSYVGLDLFVIVYAALRRKSVSLKNIIALSLTELLTILSFFVARTMENDMLIMPFVYVCDQWLLLYICSNAKWYDILRCVTETLEEKNTAAYISFSTDKLYLGCNSIAYKFFPEIEKCRVDIPLRDDSPMGELFNPWVEILEAKGYIADFDFPYGGRYFKGMVNVLPQPNHKRVYLFKIEDISLVHNHIERLDRDTSELQSSVSQNEKGIHLIQEKMISNMATMVETRDNNTGGHIMRTSQVVSILAEEMQKDQSLGLSKTFYDALIRSAPMHDLGKISVDDKILRKNGKFEPFEYECMKKHAVAGASTVELLLTNMMEPPYLIKIAKNVANYHHERWDGKGYPEGLSGTDIPIEARIMAVADVFDALVSTRCYKERMHFSKAHDIIIECMGTQFDPMMGPHFEACFERLKEYYMTVDH